MATQEEIRAKREDYDNQIAELHGEIEILHARKGVLRAQCKHPDAYTYSAMGELGRKCPDCGYQT
jgi:hypothetical protein